MTEPVVLVPGMMCDARIFAPQIQDLTRDHAVQVAPVTQGERIDDMAAFILSVAPAKFALAGLSLGGIVAMEVLRRAPERITRIALLDTNPLAETPQVAASREPQIIAARAGRFEDVMRADLRPSFFAPGPQRAEVIDLLVDMAMGLGPEVYVRQSRALQRRRDQQGTLRKCRAPALVLCGEHDGLTPLKRHELMAELIPFAELAVIEGAGHVPTIEQPEATNAALRGWLKQPYVLR